MKKSVIDRIRGSIRGNILLSEPLENHTTYQVGGNAEYLVAARDSEEASLVYAFAVSEGIPLTILGWGSNVIAPDAGIEGIVLKTLSDNARVRFQDDGIVQVDAGKNLVDLARIAGERGLSGLEPIAGIPGTVGGALIMNAGTKEGDIASVTRSVEVVTPGGKRHVFDEKECAFGYRRSLFKETGWLVLGAELQLRSGDPATICAGIDCIQAERNDKFPLELPSAGSVFKRPPGDYAGRLIEEAGCKSLRIGGAIVSERHANFIINDGGATAADIIGLIAEIRKRVFDAFGVYLELEQIPLPVTGYRR
jgi:UDP-N-acetylmuramate dehydrogenase